MTIYDEFMEDFYLHIEQNKLWIEELQNVIEKLEQRILSLELKIGNLAGSRQIPDDAWYWEHG